MNKENTKKLVQDFPSFWKHAHNLKASLMAFGFECDDGWFPLIYRLCEGIQKELDGLDEQFNEDFYVVQVKEKFAGLRFYISGGTEKIFDLIHEAEEESYRTCEKCGKPGVVRIRGGWYKCLCEDCAGDEWVVAKW